MDSTKEKIFNLFSNCKMVNGYSRALICDLQRGDIYPIPNSLYSILQFSGKATWNEVADILQISDLETFQEYYEFLVAKDLIFFDDDVHLYPAMSNDWDEPYEITNCILDFLTVDDEIINNLKYSLAGARISTFQLRFFEIVELEDIVKLLSVIQSDSLNSIEIVVKYNSTINKSGWTKLCSQFSNIFSVTVFAAPVKKYINTGDNQFGQVFFVEDAVMSEQCCGQINSNFFTINKKTFTEAMHYNSCLNRKIAIDAFGNIKNCPSMSNVLGRSGKMTFNEAIKLPELRKNWSITKDFISVCKDCEFRYICTDCRAYLQEPENILSKPLKCGYDPYAGVWEDWAAKRENLPATIHYGFPSSEPIS